MARMKRMTLLLDQDRLDEAVRLCGERSYSAVVRRAVDEFVVTLRSRRVLSLRGTGLWKGDLSVMREDTESGPEVT